MLRPAWESSVIALGTAIAGAVAYVLFDRWLPSHVLIGTRQTDAWVPASYQASVFPAFTAFAAAAALDARAGRNGWRARAVATGLLSVLAAGRLSALLPLSGHGVCCAALVSEALIAPRRSETPWVIALSAASLSLTAWYKLVVWRDPLWFAAAIAVGVLIGAATGWAGRRAQAAPG